MTEERRRTLLIACFLGGVVLLLFAVGRLPSDRWDGAWFSGGGSRAGRILGAADYVGGTMCFAAGPFFYSREAPSGHRLRDLLWEFLRSRRFKGSGFVATLMIVSLLAGAFMGVLAIGAVLSLCR
jgi:hypothetical protein